MFDWEIYPALLKLVIEATFHDRIDHKSQEFEVRARLARTTALQLSMISGLKKEKMKWKAELESQFNPASCEALDLLMSIPAQITTGVIASDNKTVVMHNVAIDPEIWFSLT